MYCKNCGTENDDNMKFCVNCGAEMGTDTTLSDKPVREIEQGTTANVQPHKLSKKTKGIILIIAVILILVATAYKICGGLMSPERVVTKYINVQADGNYSELYGMLDMPDSEFTTKSQFVDTLERSAEEAEKVSVKNINVIEANALDLSNTSKYYFTKVYDKAYRVTYDLQNGKQEQKTVFLSKQKGIFFGKYKILPTEYLIEEYKIFAPAYADVAFDGISLGDTYNSKTEDNTDQHCYLLNNILSGKHNVTATAPFIENADIEVDVNKNGSVDCLEDLVIKQEIKDQMQKTAEDTLKVIFDAAVAKKDFSEVAPQLKIASDKIDAVEQGYKSFLNISWSGFDNDVVAYDRLELSNIEPATDVSYDIYSSPNKPLSYMVQFKVISEVSPTQGNILFGERKKETGRFLYIYFTYENNELQICDIGHIA